MTGIAVKYAKLTGPNWSKVTGAIEHGESITTQQYASTLIGQRRPSMNIILVTNGDKIFNLCSHNRRDIELNGHQPRIGRGRNARLAASNTFVIMKTTFARKPYCWW